MKIKAKSDCGGCVEFAKGVSASYAVASVADHPAPPIFYAWVKLPCGRTVQVFVNRESGLVVVDIVAESGKSGVEILRKTV